MTNFRGYRLERLTFPRRRNLRQPTSQCFRVRNFSRSKVPSHEPSGQHMTDRLPNVPWKNVLEWVVSVPEESRQILAGILWNVDTPELLSFRDNVASAAIERFCEIAGTHKCLIKRFIAANMSKVCCVPFEAVKHLIEDSFVSSIHVMATVFAAIRLNEPSAGRPGLFDYVPTLYVYAIDDFRNLCRFTSCTLDERKSRIGDLPIELVQRLVPTIKQQNMLFAVRREIASLYQRMGDAMFFKANRSR